MAPKLIGSSRTMTYKSTNRYWDTMVVCVVGIILDFKNLTQTLATYLRSIQLITRPSSLAHDVPFIIIAALFDVLAVMFAINLEFSHSTS